MKILVSNPSKQYTHHTIKALLAGGHEVLFCTSYWFSSHQKMLSFLAGISKKLHRELQKRADHTIPPDIVHTHWTGEWFKWVGRFLVRDIEQRSFMEDCLHDRWVARRIRYWKPDLVIGYEKSCYRTFTQAKALGIRTILDLSQVHVTYIGQLRAAYPFFATVSGSEKIFHRIRAIKLQEYTLADHIMALSSFARTTLTDNGIEPGKTSIVNLGFNPQQFRPLRRQPAAGKPLQLVYVGIITLRKGIQLLLEVMKELEGRPVELLVVGPYGDASHLLHKKSNYPNIRYIEYLHHDALVEVLQQSDVFVLPSYLDSWAAVVVEAMACGLPVIVTENTGARDVVDTTNGVVITTGDKEALQQAIEYFLVHPERIEEMGAAAAAKVQQYEWSHYYRQVNEVVNGVGKSKVKM